MYINLLTTVKNKLLTHLPSIMASRPSSDMAKFKENLKSAKNIVFLSGAGISAESGIPTFRGAGGMWRKYQATSLATPEAFGTTPALVWEFYHYRREVAARAQPNPGHIAIAQYEARHPEKTVSVITQNVDGLHARAGTKNLLELHGNLYKTRCTKCREVLVNTDSPICKALEGRGMPDVDQVGSDIPVRDLPHCKKPECKGLLRPHIVWFGENLELAVLDKTESAMASCELCLVVGTSSVVYPAAMFAPAAAARGAAVAEFNLEPAPATTHFHYYFEGPCGMVGTSSVVYPAAMFAPAAAARGAAVAEFNLEPAPATTHFHYYFEGPCGMVGTSSVVYPAAMFAPAAAARGAAVAEFNLEPAPATTHFHYYFEGPCGMVGTSSVVYPAAMFAPAAAARGAAVAEFNLEPAPATTHFHYYFEGPCGMVGTSSVVYPAAMFAPAAAARGAAVAEFNLEPAPATTHFHYYFEGPCGITMPQALSD